MSELAYHIIPSSSEVSELAYHIIPSSSEVSELAYHTIPSSSEVSELASVFSTFVTTFHRSFLVS